MSQGLINILSKSKSGTCMPWLAVEYALHILHDLGKELDLVDMWSLNDFHDLQKIHNLLGNIQDMHDL